MKNYKVNIKAHLVKTVKANDERHACNIVNAWLRDNVLPKANPRELFVFEAELASKESTNSNPEKSEK